MKALILAAGLGSRLKDETKVIPKALVDIGGKPILGIQLDALRQNGITQVTIVIGYQGEKIVDYVGEFHPDLAVQYVENPKYASTNSANSFWLARATIRHDSYVHLNCDIIVSPNLISRMLAHPEDNVIAVRHDYPLGPNMEQVSLEGERIISMDNQPFDTAQAKAFGVAKLSRESTEFALDLIRTYIEAGDNNQNYYGMLRQAVKQLSYFALDAGEDTLLEVNTVEDLLVAKTRLERDSPRSRSA